MKKNVIVLLFITGFFSSSFSQNSNSTEQEPFVFAEQMPQFPGGKDSLNLYLHNNVKYPNKALEMEIEGTVIVNFLINEDGEISQAKVTTGIGGGCDEEALRVINKMPKWVPARQSGIAVPIYYLLPVNFKIE